MWKNVLRPDICKEKWSKEEINLLKSLAEKYEMREWENIAEELGVCVDKTMK